MNKFSFTITALLALCVSTASAGEMHCALVQKVIDGDTILVSMLDTTNKPEYIRLVGIDAPELGQPFGCAAAWKLRTLVEGYLIQVEVVARDRYGRLLATIKLGRIDPALKLTKAGLAWGLKQPYISAMVAAKAAKLGLWSQRNPIHPAAYRRRAKNVSKR